MRYPAKFEAADEGGYVVTFRDIPEAITQGDDMEDAMEMARDALQSAMEFYFEDGRRVPEPSNLEAGEHLISLPASLWSKVLLLNEMVGQGIKQVELARLMKIKPQQVTRIVDLSHPTKIDEIERAFEAIGKHLELRVA